MNNAIISKLYNRVKAFIFVNQREIVLGIAVFLISIISFGLGRISVKLPSESPIIVQNLPISGADYQQGYKTTLKTEINQNKPLNTDFTASVVQPGQVVASKNSDKYHYPWCPGALKIKEENKITFQSIEEARSAGYEPAANCPGLE